MAVFYKAQEKFWSVQEDAQCKNGKRKRKGKQLENV